MNETPTIDIFDDYTIDIKETTSIEINNTGHLKSRFTTVLTIAGNGHRLTTFIVFRKLPKIQIIKVSSNIMIAVSNSGFVDTALMKDYIDRVIKPYLNGRIGLLVFDNYAAHKTPSVIRELDSIKVIHKHTALNL